MAADADLGTVAQVLSGGGLLAFSFMVWLEQRGMRPELKGIREALVAVLEHVRKETK